MADKIAVNYYDALLRESDVQLLSDHNWLNDRLIGFWFEYLTHSVVKDDTRFAFVSPEVTQFIKLSSREEVGMFLQPLELHCKQFIFMAVNDSVCVDSISGSHWSCMVYVRPIGKLFHFDSMNGSNLRQAQQIATKIAQFWGCLDVQEALCMQQTNGYDCGVHVAANCERAARLCAAGSYHSLVNLCVNVAGKRKEMAAIINGLRE